MRRYAKSSFTWLIAGALLGAATAHAEALVVIVNPASKVQALSRSEVIDIYLGRYRQLPSGATALPIDIGGKDPSRAQFYSLLVRKNLAEIGSYWARLVFSGQAAPPFQVADVKTALDLVADNPNAIAYVNASAADKRVRVVFELK